MQDNFIKKGVIDEEQAGAIVKTASDELVASQETKGCCGKNPICRCRQTKSTNNSKSTGGSDATKCT